MTLKINCQFAKNTESSVSLIIICFHGSRGLISKLKATVGKRGIRIQTKNPIKDLLDITCVDKLTRFFGQHVFIVKK